MKFEIEIDGVNAPIDDVETAIKDVLYNQLDMELEADYKTFKVNVNYINDKEEYVMRKIKNESKSPHMWAIDYRNMNTAIHGLFYGKDRKDVQHFYRELKYIDSEYMDGWMIDELMNTYNVDMIDEINYREIRKLPSGRYGIEIDDVEYWIINDV